MFIKKIIMLCGVVLGFVTSVRAAEAVAQGTPDALIHEVYKAGDKVFAPTANKKLAAKFLTPELVKLLLADEKRSREEPYMGFIDCSVIYYSQDQSKVTKLATKSVVKGETAVVKASFDYAGESMLITYHCAKEADAWRIADVVYSDKNSVLKMLKKNAK